VLPLLLYVLVLLLYMLLLPLQGAPLTRGSGFRKHEWRGGGPSGVAIMDAVDAAVAAITDTASATNATTTTAAAAADAPAPAADAGTQSRPGSSLGFANPWPSAVSSGSSSYAEAAADANATAATAAGAIACAIGDDAVRVPAIAGDHRYPVVRQANAVACQGGREVADPLCDRLGVRLGAQHSAAGHFQREL
jgi:hypothetical protein